MFRGGIPTKLKNLQTLVVKKAALLMQEERTHFVSQLTDLIYSFKYLDTGKWASLVAQQ